MPSLEFSHNLRHEVKLWDRFIRNRDEVKHRILDVPEEDVSASGDNIIDQKPYSSSEETYKYLVAHTLGLNPRPNSWTPQWPVKPRSNPHLTSPGVILDLPSIRRTFFGSNVMDWSQSDYLTVGFPRNVYLWHSTTNRTLKIETKNTSCLKWNREGTDLFIASRSGTFRFADAAAQENLTAGRTPCHLGCFFSCCVFHPASPIMYIGCCMGSVTAYHVMKGMHIIAQIHEDDSENSYITNLGLSNDGGQLAIASMANMVFIYDTVAFDFLYSINMTGPSRALAWHPWKRNLLVVSDCHGYMALYDTFAPMSPPQATYFSAIDSSILNLTFNPISAELVVSQRVLIDGTGRNMRNQIPARYEVQLSVLSSFNRVVDRMEGHVGAVNFLSWNPDGTQLATAGSDETARIWDFLPQRKNIKQRTNKTSCKLNSVSASLEIGNRMGLAIR